MAHSLLYIRIMNSKQWKLARRLKLVANPLCEECKKAGRIKEAQCVHHLVEIESAKTDMEAWQLATSMGNLQSLCFDCHNAIHTQLKSHTKEAHQERNKERLQQWITRQRKEKP